MDLNNVLFWNVDTQNDFVDPEGKLYVPGAELIKPVWEELTKLARLKNIMLVNTCDHHNPDSKELSKSPNFVTTFPEHCMANTPGADFIKETMPLDTVVIDWDKEYTISDQLLEKRNIVIRKDVFDVFKGNPYTETILETISPQKVFVYGVTTNVCVNDAVVGLAGRVDEVYVLMDAIKELPTIPLPFDNWKKLGVKMISVEELMVMLKG